MKNDKLTRRNFIKKATLAGASLAVGGGLLTGLNALAQGKVYLPLILKSPEPTGEPTAEPTGEPTAEPTEEPPPPPTGSRVVHVYDSNATYWDFGSNYYGRYVDQDVVNDMVDRGLRNLTGASTVAEAWDTLFKAVNANGYQPGQDIAIKVNFNNNSYCEHFCETNCEDWRLKIDALINPVNAVVRGLKQIGVAEEDIWVYDATPGRKMTGRFTSRCLYPGVQFFDDNCHNPARFDSNDPNAYVDFSRSIPSQKITDVLINATYLINMPIMKKHGGAGVTLSFKNHFGSIDDCSALHAYIYDGGDHYSTSYNPLVDIYRNPHILNKTVLTVGDGLYGDRKSNTNKPTPWNTFGGQAPNSLFFATDPVAVDCVMCDFLHAERGSLPMSDDYLVLAEAAGLGTYERGDPWQEPYGSGYSKIEYMRF